MSKPKVPYDDLIENLNTSSQGAAVSALRTLLKQKVGDDATELAAYIAKSLHAMKAVSATHTGLAFLQPWRDVPEVLDLAIDLVGPPEEDAQSNKDAGAREALSKARVFAVSFLAQSNEDRAYAALYSLITDSDQAVRDAAIGVVPELASKTAESPEAASLTVLQSEEDQKLALEVLDELDKAIHKLLDPADLEAGQVELIEKEVLPRIDQLKGILSAPLAGSKEQRVARKQSLGIGNKLLGSAKAVAYGVTGLAQADKAHQNVLGFVEKLQPLIDSISDLLP